MSELSIVLTASTSKWPRNDNRAVANLTLLQRQGINIGLVIAVNERKPNWGASWMVQRWSAENETAFFHEIMSVVVTVNLNGEFSRMQKRCWGNTAKLKFCWGTRKVLICSVNVILMKCGIYHDDKLHFQSRESNEMAEWLYTDKKYGVTGF